MRFSFFNKKSLYLLVVICTSFLALSVICMFHIISPTEKEEYRTGLLEKMEQASSFSDFTNALFCYEVSSDSITTAYILKDPAAYGIPPLSPVLSTFSAKEYKKNLTEKNREKMLSLFSDTLKQFNISNLEESDQITYSLLQKHIEQNQDLCPYAYYEDLLGRTTGIQANLPVTLGEYPLHTEENINTYLGLLTQIPEYFKNVISYEKERTRLGFATPDFLLNGTKKELSALLEGFENGENCFIDTFEERIDQINGLSRKKGENYKKKNRDYVENYVIPAYQDLYDYVEQCLSKNSSSPASSGKASDPETTPPSSSGTKKTPEPSNSIAKDNTDSSTSIPKETSEGSYSVNKEFIPESDISYGLSSFPDGKEYYSLLVRENTGSYRSVPELIAMSEQSLSQALGEVLNIALTDETAYLYYCDHPLETYYQSPEAILESLSLMIRKDYPSLKDVPSYTVKSVPNSLAESLSPAFYMIPPIDDYRNNTIYINSLYTNEENGNLFTTLAHEGFPGHMYQSVYFNDTNPDPVRQILNYPGYVEGWATYVELNAFTFLDYPLEGDTLCRLYQADTIINLALCCRIDLGVNYENWTLEDVCNFFERNGFKSYYAADVYSYVVEAPSNYLSYFIGYLEIEDLKAAYRQQEMENYSEKDFHEKMLTIGPSDFETLRNYMLVNP